MSDIDKNSDEFKQAVADAIAEQTEGLKRKNDELLGKIKKLQQGQTISPEDLAAVEAERDEWKAKASDATKAANKAAKDAEAAVKRASDLDTAFNNTLKDGALVEALTKAGVTNPALVKAAKAMLANGLQVTQEGDARVVKAGDKALSDFITEWAGSDEGKHFVTAADVSGGGSQGGRRVNAGGKSLTRAQFDALAPEARSAHFAEGGTVTD